MKKLTILEYLIGTWSPAWKNNMKDIALFVKDFEKGTELSNQLTDIDMHVTFAESIYDLPDQCQIGIIDLDDEKFGNVQFISELNRHSGMMLLGYMEKITKDVQDKLKAAGCNMILTTASVVKNIPSVIHEIAKWEKAKRKKKAERHW